MDVITCIKQRRSIRHFKPEAPTRAIIMECLEAAAWAPNPTSQQPWRFIVVTGDSIRKVAAVIAREYAQAAARKDELPAPPVNEETARVLAERKRETFAEMLAFLQDRQADMKAVGEGNFNFHRAPAAVIFGVYPCRDQNFLKSGVAAMENFMLAAAARGLGTCWSNAVSICQESVRAALDLPSDLILVDGIAVGYPVEGSPINDIPRRRLPIEDVTEWRE